MPFRPAHHDPKAHYVEGIHPSMLDDKELLAQCHVDIGRVSGPGGQHRNRVETAVWIQHVASGVEAQGTERRSQIQNRHVALFRLRLKLASHVRTWMPRDGYRPSELWRLRRQGEKMPVNPKHEHYPALLAEAMDVIVARGFDVAGAAGILGITMSQLSRLVRHHKHAFAIVNEGRESRGLPRFR